MVFSLRCINYEIYIYKSRIKLEEGGANCAFRIKLPSLISLGIKRETETAYGKEEVRQGYSVNE